VTQAASSSTLGAIFSLHRDQLEQLAQSSRSLRTSRRSLTTRTQQKKSPTLRTAEQRMPTLAGKYLVRESIGKGAFGHVYRALDRSSGREVALKLVQSRHAFSPNVAARFLREARALQTLDHPGVVRIFELIQEKHAMGLAMEFVPGRSLDVSVTEDGPLTQKAAAQVGRDIAAALREVHGAGFVHRDVKAENIIRRPDGQAVLLDFGITRPVGDFTKLTAEGMLVGTPLSMAPEQLEFLPVDGRTDVYATGCLLYYLLTARHPIEEHTMEELRRRVLQGDYAALRVRRPDVSGALEDVVEKAMRQPQNGATRPHRSWKRR
jgi:serine/threonine protein kinase